MSKREFTPEEIAKSLEVCFGTCCGCGGCIYEVEPDLSSPEADCRTDLVNIAAGMIKAQAKRIGELEAELAKLREENRWIPVEERLPDKDGVYEVWKNVKHPHLGQQFDKAQFHNGSWHGNGGRWTNVTHWKPMPKGPEVGHD